MLNQYLPVFLLGLFFSSYEVGLFAAPYRIVLLVCHSGFLVVVAVYPVLSELHHKEPAKFLSTQKALLMLMALLGGVAAIFGMVFSGQIIRLLLGDDYMNSKPLFMLMIWLIPMYFLRFILGPSLQALGRQRLHSVSTLCGSVMAVLVGGACTYYFGTVGGALCVLIAEVTAVCMMFHFHSKLKVGGAFQDA
jgi:O-antigen/teichoic acid export membrane protein